MILNPNQLYETLKELAVIDTKLLDESFRKSAETHIPLTTILLTQDLISDENLGKIVADLYSAPFVRLSQTSIPESVLTIIPEVVAKRQQAIAFQQDTRGLSVAMSNPHNLEFLSLLKKKTGTTVIAYYATEHDIQNALSLYRKDVKQAFEDIIKTNIHQARTQASTEPPIIKIVDTIIQYAYENRASDIHLEPLEHISLVRFRIDGILHDIVELPLQLHPQIVIRIKVLANLRTDEHHAPQDGKISYKTEYENLDIRVSIVPITGGEKVVLRLLSERSRQFSLRDLGFSQHDLTLVEQTYRKPYGMILSTGPTGSGKTTTLYALLKLLNKRDVNIMTIEDPVEYEIEGVNQLQVNPKADLTFARGLRSIVRQDPNIILVGEIRDEETAGIAVNSAMTGHLVLSTMHTNDTATAIPRFLNMQIEPFLIASTINVIVAQRLVRKICQKCRVSIEFPLDHLKKQLSASTVTKHFDNVREVRVYQGKGCEVCHQTGYIGRIGIFEVMLMQDAIRTVIINRQDAGAIREVAIKNGMTTMLDDGIDKVKQGITTLEEIIRVTAE
ncbi:type II/IV secretion system protein [Candidatus Roizmanbacteria bacterium]|nr:type II/IV secretion system protein [Candidatus Roizmanbacteria bacterium]